MVEELDFERTLAELLALLGREVTVVISATACGGPPLAAQFSGRLREGTDIARLHGEDEEETYIFAFVDAPHSAFFVHRSDFKGAEVNDTHTKLTIFTGGLELVLEVEEN